MPKKPTPTQLKMQALETELREVVMSADLTYLEIIGVLECLKMELSQDHWHHSLRTAMGKGMKVNAGEMPGDILEALKRIIEDED